MKKINYTQLVLGEADLILYSIIQEGRSQNSEVKNALYLALTF
jgi:hypothetical protein